MDAVVDSVTDSGRDFVSFQGDTFEVAASVQVRNERTGQGCYLSSFEFLEQHSIFKDEVRPLFATTDVVEKKIAICR